MKHGIIGRARTVTEVGGLVRKIRAEQGLQQSDLAELTQVSRMTISRLERGEDVGIKTVIRALSECGYAITIAPKFTKLQAVES